MKRVLHHHHGLLALVVVLLLILALLPANWAAAISDRPRGVFQFIRAPLAVPLHSMGRVRSEDELSLDLERGQDLAENYRRMLAYNARLETQIIEQRRRLAAYEDARSQLGEGVRPLLARVTGATMRPAEDRRIAIDRGYMDGVRVNQVVTSSLFQLVGHVTETGPRTATVRLITSEDRAPKVRIMPPLPDESPRSHPALLKIGPEGDVFYADGRDDSPVETGDVARLMDQSWPLEAQGLEVGQVIDVAEVPQQPLKRLITVSPSHNLAYLTTVILFIPVDDSPRARRSAAAPTA